MRVGNLSARKLRRDPALRTHINRCVENGEHILHDPPEKSNSPAAFMERVGVVACLVEGHAVSHPDPMLFSDMGQGTGSLP